MVGGRSSCFPLMQYECACGTYRTYHCILAPDCSSPVLLGFVVVPLPSLPYATHMAGVAPVWISHGTAPFLGRCYPLGGASCWSGTDGPAQLSWVASSHRQAISQSVAVGACVCVTSCLGFLVGCLYYTCAAPCISFLPCMCLLCPCLHSSSTAYGGWPA